MTPRPHKASKAASQGASGTTGNAFGQGTKEDDPAVSVVTGSIPPNKTDLTRFYVANEFTGGNNFLHLAWERSRSTSPTAAATQCSAC